MYAGANLANKVDPYGLSDKDVKRIVSKYYETLNQWTAEGKRHPNPWWNNFCRYYGIPGCENYENCEGQTDSMIGVLMSPDVPYDDTWIFEVEHNFDIKPGWYPGHNWVRARSNNPNDPSIWLDPRAGSHGEGFCEVCY